MISGARVFWGRSRSQLDLKSGDLPSPTRSLKATKVDLWAFCENANPDRRPPYKASAPPFLRVSGANKIDNGKAFNIKWSHGKRTQPS